MTNFKIGDKVKVFPSGRPSFEGTITSIDDASYPCNTWYYITEDGFYSSHDECPFHAEQLRLVDPVLTPFGELENRVGKLETKFTCLFANESNLYKRIEALELINTNNDTVKNARYYSLIERIENLESLPKTIVDRTNDLWGTIKILLERIQKLEKTK